MKMTVTVENEIEVTGGLAAFSSHLPCPPIALLPEKGKEEEEKL